MTRKEQAFRLEMEILQNLTRTLKLVSLKDIDDAVEYARLSGALTAKIAQLTDLVQD